MVSRRKFLVCSLSSEEQKLHLLTAIYLPDFVKCNHLTFVVISS